MSKLLHTIAFASIISLTAGAPLVAGAQDTAAIDSALAQCKTAYARARDLKMSQQESAEAYEQYRTALLDILEELNKTHNAAPEETMSREQLSHSVRVMGEVLQMLVNPPPTRSGYLF
ncbi:MAG: hypothetical protein U5S82_09930 [Gammaproteobacteria bacterium]|nr:hypothetical protein [Gammaproteobacteria bacterium]